MKLSDITEKTPLLKQFRDRLAKATKQAIPIVNILKISRVSGASARPVELVLENGQTVKIYVRTVGDESDKLDIFRIDINGKQTPLSGDYDNSYAPSFNASVDALGQTIIRGQAAFDKQQAKIKIKNIPKTAPPKNKVQQLNALKEQVQELDAVIASKTEQKNQMAEKLEQIKAQNAA